MNRLSQHYLGVACVLLTGMLMLAGATGRLAPHMVPDSASYLEYPFESLDMALRSIRTPGYPIFLAIVNATLGLRAVPAVQILLHACAAAWLVRELLLWKASLASAWAAGWAVALGCTMLDNASTIATDLPGASAGVMTAVALLRWIRLEQSAASAILVVILATLAIAIRPAYLAIVPWVVLCGTLLSLKRDLQLHRASRWVHRWRRPMLLGVAITVPLVAWILLRGFFVGDFAILPFGHQNLAGITVQLATDNELRSLDGEAGQFAGAILAKRDEVARDGHLFAAGDAASTMTLENRWDDYVWLVIVPAARERYGEESITTHRSIASFNRAVLTEYPARYVRWLLLASRRAMWGTAANIVMHPIFLVAIVGAVLWKIVRVLSNCKRPSPCDDPASDVMLLVAASYFVVHVGFVILTSPPLGRFADAAAIFIPAYIAMLVTRHVVFPHPADSFPTRRP